MAKFNVTKMSQAFYEEHLSEYEIMYASISEEGDIQICAKEMIDDQSGRPPEAIEDYPYKIITFSEIVPTDDHLHASTWTGIKYLYSAFLPDEGRSVVLTDVFRVSERDTPIMDIGKPRSEWDDYTRMGAGLKVIGDHVYAAGGIRKLFRRDDVGEWTDLTDPDKHPNLFKRLKFLKERDGDYGNSFEGFDAVDGFSETDIYAGGLRDLCRFDGKRWHEIMLPEYPSINAVLCAEDGYVYVTGRGGPVLRGREERWEVLDAPALDYKSLAWFDGKVWLGSDYELGVMEDGKYQRYEFPEDGPAQFSFFGVDANNDLLMSYGTEQVMLFDGKQWLEMAGPKLV